MARRSRRNARRLRRAALRRDLCIERRQGEATAKLRFPSAGRAPPTARPMRRTAAVAALPSSSPRRRRLRFSALHGRSARPRRGPLGRPAPQSPPRARRGLDDSPIPCRPRQQRSRRPRRRLRLAALARPRAAPCLPHLERCQSGSMDWLATPVRPRHVRGPPRVRIPPSPPTTACSAPSRESTRDARGEFGGQPRATPRSQEARKPPHAHASRRPRQAWAPRSGGCARLRARASGEPGARRCPTWRCCWSAATAEAPPPASSPTGGGSCRANAPPCCALPAPTWSATRARTDAWTNGEADA